MTGEGRNPDRIPMHSAAYSLPHQVTGTRDQHRQLDPPVPVRVWVIRPKPIGWRRYDGEATAWHGRTVHVRYWDEHGLSDDAWVWANAVERRT